MKKCIILIFLVCIFLCGCTAYNKTYTVISEYRPEVKNEPKAGDRIAVDSQDELFRAVLSIIEKNDQSGLVSFSSDYDGDPSTDISSVCKQIITRNPLCAYCVENINYEFYNVITTTEALIEIAYAQNAIPITQVIRLGYSGELKNTLNKILSDGLKKTAILINHSTLSDTEIKELILDLYYSSPLCSPFEPNISVNMFSDYAYQKLYEINIDYKVTEDEYSYFLQNINDIAYAFPEKSGEGDLYSVMEAAAYIINNCAISSSPLDNSAYSALFKGKADSKGLSLAFISLCKDKGIECRLVYGQKEWRNHYWNLVKIDQSWYHIDIIDCIENGIASGFLINDDGMWKSYRWNLSEYPKCDNSLSYPMVYFTTAEEFYAHSS